MPNSKLQASFRDGIGRIAFNRPEAKNAISKQMWQEIPELMKGLKSRGSRLIVFEGSNDCFASGADLQDLKEIESPAAAREFWAAISECLDFVWRFDLATVAAVDGPCIGGACLLACACDLRYASRRASFAIPVSKLGIVLDDASLARLASLVGIARAKEMIFRAASLNAEEAMAIGLVNQVFHEQEYAAILEFVLAEIISNSPVSIAESKSSLLRAFAPENGPAFSSGNLDRVIESYLSSEFGERLDSALKRT